MFTPWHTHTHTQLFSVLIFIVVVVVFRGVGVVGVDCATCLHRKCEAPNFPLSVKLNCFLNLAKKCKGRQKVLQGLSARLPLSNLVVCGSLRHNT